MRARRRGWLLPHSKILCSSFAPTPLGLFYSRKHRPGRRLTEAQILDAIDTPATPQACRASAFLEAKGARSIKPRRMGKSVRWMGKPYLARAHAFIDGSSIAADESGSQN